MFGRMMVVAAIMTAGAAWGEDHVLPFVIEQISGSRPVVAIDVNGHPFKAFVHANAGMYLQINHAQAAAWGARDLKHKDHYGIEAPGKVSDLGRDTGTIDRLEVAGVVDRAVPVAVFEKPVDIAMLGLGWITAHGVIVDYRHSTIVLPGAAASHAQWRTKLVAEGYTAIAMTHDDSDGRYLVTAAIGNQSAEMVVSTVVDAELDTGFAARAGVKTGAVIDTYGGPAGATGNVYQSADAVTLTIGGWKASPRRIAIEDTYAYSSVARPDHPRGGTIGADFLIAHQAVIDFGSQTLYLR